MWLTRLSSLAMRSFAAMISLNESATFPSRSVQSDGRRTEKTPFSTAVRHFRIRRMTCVFERVPDRTWPLPLLSKAAFFLMKIDPQATRAAADQQKKPDTLPELGKV